MFLRFVVPPLVVAELDMAVFSFNMQFPGLFISLECCHIAAFPYALITIINSSGAAKLDFVTRRLL